jgi:hypothetical protein
MEQRTITDKLTVEKVSDDDSSSSADEDDEEYKPETETRGKKTLKDDIAERQRSSTLTG